VKGVLRLGLAGRGALGWCCLAAPLVIGCGDGLSVQRPTDVTLEKSTSVATVVTVKFGTPAPSTAYVEYGPTTAMGYSTPMETEPKTDHSLLLAGLRADTSYTYRIVTWDGREAGASEVSAFRTDALPAELPNFTQTGGGLDRFVVVPLVGGPPTVAILDAEGQVVWYHEDERGLDIHRAILAADAASVLYDASLLGEDSTPDSEIVRVGLDGTEIESFPVPYLAGDFVELEDGTLAAIAMEDPGSSGTLRGDQIVEISPQGDVSTVFSTADCFDEARDIGDGSGSVWTLANAIDYVKVGDEESYYVGLENLSSIVKVDRASGDCSWVVGSTAPTLAFADGSRVFRHQHQFTTYGDSLLVMDNDGDPNEARLVEYALDLDATTATETRIVRSSPAVHVAAFGEPTRISGGDLFVSWGSAGRLELITEDDESTWRVEAPEGTSFGYHHLVGSLYAGPVRTP